MKLHIKHHRKTTTEKHIGKHIGKTNRKHIYGNTQETMHMQRTYEKHGGTTHTKNNRKTHRKTPEGKHIGKQHREHT